MSAANVPEGHVLAVFVSPFFRRLDEVEGPTFTSALADLINAPPFSGTLDADVILPGTEPIRTDANQNIVGGGTPTYGCCMHLVVAAPATINALDAQPDIVRIQPFAGLTPQQRQTQMQSIEAWLNTKGVMTDFSDTLSTREMAARIATVLQPGFQGFNPNFDVLFPD